MKRSRPGKDPDPARHPDIRLFENMTGAVVDSSSLILMEKAGFLELLSGELELFAIPEVLDETGRSGFEERVKPLDINDSYSPERRRTDRLVVHAAVLKELPVLAEDKKILLEADREGVPYFNALMMLNFLFWKGAIDDAAYESLERKLLASARYSHAILEYARNLYYEILKDR